MSYRLPGNSERIAVIGRTGSGKSRAAVWHLSKKDFTRSPWIVLNHKNEDHIDNLPGAQFIDLDDVPKKPGLYVYHPTPEADDERVTELLWKFHRRRNIGVYIDEGYMINPRDPALIALYTQGRSLKIPMITLSQRPSRICRFGISEAEFFQIFQLTDARDRKTIQEFVPYNIEPLMSAEIGKARQLPEFNSLYYDVSKNRLHRMLPVPDDDVIYSVFDAKLNSKNKSFFLI